MEWCPRPHPKLNLRKRIFPTKRDAQNFLKETKQKNQWVYRCRYCHKWHLYSLEDVPKPDKSDPRTEQILAKPLQQSALTEEQAKLLQEKFGSAS